MTRQLDPLDAFCRHVDVEIPGRAGGPLSGRTFGAKDIFDVEGHVCSAGNPDWLAARAPALTTASAIRKLVDAGATLVGKTHTTELAYSGTGHNPHYGTPLNPAAPGHLPGGSSSGSASAVAAGALDIALGSDTTGSVRIPAALCGIYGLRTTHGSVADDGVMPLAPSFDTVGGFARDLELLYTCSQALLDERPVRPAWSRVVLATDVWGAADPSVASQAMRAAELLVDSRPVDRSEVCASPGGLHDWGESVRIVQAFEVWQTHGEWVRSTEPEIGTFVRRRLEMASQVGADEESAARADCEAAGRHVRAVVGDSGVMVFPTCPTGAPSLETSDDDLLVWWSRVSQLTVLANVSGLPQLTVPAGAVDGLPVGLSLLGPARSELALIRLASELTR